jgi:hypothetical protein
MTVMASEKKDDEGKELAFFKPRVKMPGILSNNYCFFIISKMKSRGNY